MFALTGLRLLVVRAADLLKVLLPRAVTPHVTTRASEEITILPGPDFESILYCLWKFFSQSFWEEDCEHSGQRGNHSHDEDGSGTPVHLEEVEQEADDASDPGHQGAGSHRLVPDHSGEHLGRVDEHNPPDCACPELAEEGE